MPLPKIIDNQHPDFEQYVNQVTVNLERLGVKNCNFSLYALHAALVAEITPVDMAYQIVKQNEPRKKKTVEVD